jgi:hypothetical protein
LKDEINDLTSKILLTCTTPIPVCIDLSKGILILELLKSYKWY